MSHFTVIVVTGQEPNEDVLRNALIPYHEFECTGVVNEYVKSVIVTEEDKKEYDTKTQPCIKMLDGSLCKSWEDQFYRDPTPEEEKEIEPFAGSGCNAKISWCSQDWNDGKGYRVKVKYLPEGCEEVEVPFKELMSFKEFLQTYYREGTPILEENEEPDLEDTHKWGWIRLNANGEVFEVINRTNPNSHWDWWTIGGRWSGMLLPKNGGEATDSLMKGDIDSEKMLATEKALRTETLDKALVKVCEKTGKSTKELLEIHFEAVSAWDKTEKEWNDLEENPKPRLWDWIRSQENHPICIVDKLKLWDRFDGFPETCYKLPNPYDWVEQAAPVSAFAVVKDGKWFSRGGMGWWGCVSDKKDNWKKTFKDLYDSIPDDHYITFVDCHIQLKKGRSL